MAVTLTPNLQLRVNSSLTSDAKFNLYKLDELGAVWNLDASGDVSVRAEGNITFRPEDSSVGGSGSGGTITFGAADQLLSGVNFYGNVTLTGSLGLNDTATGSTGHLSITYKSDVSGSLDNTARTVYVDVNGANRNLILGGDFSLTGGLSFVSSAYVVTVPATGTMVLTNNSQTLTGKSLDADNNTLTNIADAAIKSAAAISGTKISPNFGSQNLRSTGLWQIAKDGSVATMLTANSAQSANITLTLPAAAPTSGSILRYTGTELEWSTTAGAGTVTSVAADLSAEAAAFLTWSGSPITTLGTLTLDLDTQSSNTVFSGPSSGGLAKPSFRALVSDDIPTLTTAKISDFNSAWDTRLSTKTTSNLTEGSNLYYTQSRFDTAYAAKAYATDWTSGLSFTATHSLGTRDVFVEIYDNTTFETILVDSVVRTTINAVDFTTTQAPSGAGWRVLIRS